MTTRNFHEEKFDSSYNKPIYLDASVELRLNPNLHNLTLPMTKDHQRDAALAFVFISFYTSILHTIQLRYFSQTIPTKDLPFKVAVFVHCPLYTITLLPPRKNFPSLYNGACNRKLGRFHCLGALRMNAFVCGGGVCSGGS